MSTSPPTGSIPETTSLRGTRLAQSALVARSVRVLIVFSLLLPAFVSFNYVFRFAVDVPFWDQWDFAQHLIELETGRLTLQEVVSQHNEHRILFARIVMLGLAWLTRWDTRAEMWFGWAALFLAALVLLREHVRTFGRNPGALAAFIAPAWLIFTVRQSENLLWGFQLQIFMAMCAACVALVLLTRDDLPDRRVLLAGAAGFVGSFSFSAGLCIWPAGLAVVLLRSAGTHRPRSALIWLGCALATVFLFFFHYRLPPYTPSTSFAFQHLQQAARFFSAMLGSSLVRQADVSVAIAIGAVLVSLTVLIAIAAAGGAVDLGKARLGLGLVLFAWFAAAMTTVGRVGFNDGPEGVGLSTTGRYTTITLLGVYGVYRLGESLRAVAARSAVLGSLVTLIAVGSILALRSEYDIGKSVRSARRRMQTILLNYRQSPDSELQILFINPGQVRGHAARLDELRLSVFRKR